MLTPDAKVDGIARRQHGLVTRQQAIRLGMSRGQLERRLESGRFIPAGRGVYRLRSVAQSWDQRALAPCLAGGEGTVLFGRSAATVWKMDLPPARDIHVVRPKSKCWKPSGDGVVWHQNRWLTRKDCVKVGALPVTSAPRTLVDLAGILDPAVLARVLDDALVRGLVTVRQLSAAIAAAPSRGAKGIGALRKALQPWMAGTRFDSVAEVACLRRMLDAGLPPPVCQFEVVRADGRRAVLDFAWPDQLLGLEVNGFQWHGGARAHADDSLRANNLAAKGWTILSVTPKELAEDSPAWVEALRERLLAP